MVRFADDTMLYKKFTKNKYLNDRERFNTQLKKVSDWDLMGNNLKLNLIKPEA